MRVKPPPYPFAYCFILSLRTAYGHILALHTVNNKNSLSVVFIYKKNIKIQFVASTGAIVFTNVSFNVLV